MKTHTHDSVYRKRSKHRLGDPVSEDDRALLERLYFLASMGGLVCAGDAEPLDSLEHDEEFWSLLNDGIDRGFDLPMEEDACDCKMCMEMLKEQVWEQFRRLKVY